jgi:hypothetical protein
MEAKLAYYKHMAALVEANMEKSGRDVEAKRQEGIRKVHESVEAYKKTRREEQAAQVNAVETESDIDGVTTTTT